MDTMALINAALASPMTHRVVTLFEDGKTCSHDCRSLAAAENWAIGERRKIGRSYIDRATGKPVRRVSVEILGLN